MNARRMRKLLTTLEAKAPCPVCEGRAWAIKLWREYPDGKMVPQPGSEGQADEPDPCPRCTPPGAVTSIVFVMPFDDRAKD